MAVTGRNGFFEKHTAAGDGEGSTHNIHLSHVIWWGFTDGTHELRVKNGAGSIVLPTITCGAAATVIGPIVIPINRVMTGIETDKIDSGTVCYYYK
jgi:hypothetical protein